MIKIRRLSCFDIPKLKKLISYLCADDSEKLSQNVVQMSFGLVNAAMPLSLKFKPESFILIRDNEICALITVETTAGNPYKINITRLIFKDNDYETGKTLVDFIVQKFGAKGANTFTVSVDESHDELFDLFINGCGFRQCGAETLWKLDKPVPQKTIQRLRFAQNSDAKNIAQLYNSEIDPIFKPSLERMPQEFRENFFGGFCRYYKIRYLLESDLNLLGYFSITTTDNLNYIIDITTNSGYDIDYNEVLNTLLCEIASKKHAFFPLVKQKKYTKKSENLESFLKKNNYYPVQTRQILVKDFYRQETQSTQDWKVFLFGENQISV